MEDKSYFAVRKRTPNDKYVYFKGNATNVKWEVFNKAQWIVTGK